MSWASISASFQICLNLFIVGLKTNGKKQKTNNDSDKIPLVRNISEYCLMFLISVFKSVHWFFRTNVKKDNKPENNAATVAKVVLPAEEVVYKKTIVRKLSDKETEAYKAKQVIAETEKYVSHNKNNLTLDDRFETTLFAGPPFVEYVTALSADIDGTVYVSVDPNGS